jgi:DNA polymerase-3 subunit epsilon
MGFLDRFRDNRRSAPEASSQTAAPRTEPSTIPTPGQPHFAVIDVETTGLSASQHRIVEVAVVTTDPWGRVLDEWSTRINPQGPVGATHIHGITDADVANAPVFADVIGQLNLRLAGAAVAAHHASFDLAFLRAEYARAGWDMPHLPALCTLEGSQYYLPMLDRRRLADCCWAVGTPLTGAHSALGDARATAALLAAYMHPRVGYPPLAEHIEMPTNALRMSWPAGPSRAPSQATTLPPSPRSRPSPSTRAQYVMAQEAVAAPPQALVELVERFSLIDALDEGAPAGALAYLEKLAEVLEDGEVSAEETADLAVVADSEQLTNSDIAAANQAFVLALAHAALEDGKVTRAERGELQTVSDVLGVSQKVIPALLDRAENARNQRLSADLKDLPDGWPYGEPLRVGDKVVFTGCDESLRTHLEHKSEQLGVRIINAVSAKTSMLITDGTMNGGKAAKARELGTRTADPSTYSVLLEHLQPALIRGTKPLPKASAPLDPRHSNALDAPVLLEASEAELTPAGSNPAAVRDWARASGYEVGTRGRLHQEVINAYYAAHPH